MISKTGVEVVFPDAKSGSKVLDAAVNTPATEVNAGKAALRMYPFEVRTFHVTNN